MRPPLLTGPDALDENGALGILYRIGIPGVLEFVPPEDPPALAAMIRRAWEDDALRKSTAARGCQYATSLGGEQDLYRNILNHLGPFMSRLSKA